MNRILVPLDSSPFTDAAVEFACFLAKRRQAEVAGLVVLDVPGIEKSIGSVPVGALYYAELRIAEEEKRAEQRIHALLENFKSKCQESGVAHVESERQGSPSQNIALESRFCDCLVVGLRTYFTYRADPGSDNVYGTIDDHTGNTLDDLMDHSAVPLFAVPQRWMYPGRPMKVVVAFDGNLLSVRALHQFASLLHGEPASVTVVISDEARERGHFLLGQAAAFLERHGFAGVKTEWTGQPIRRAMAETYSKDADLIVLGAHSKSVLIDFVVGNLCKDFLDRGDKLLLIGH